jgi:hypothetical protein
VGTESLKATIEAARKTEGMKEIVAVRLIEEKGVSRVYELNLRDYQGNRSEARYQVEWKENPTPGQPSCPHPFAEKIQ